MVAAGQEGASWLDCAVITATHLIGIESKRYEPFRRGKPAVFSDAYWRDVWGEEMGAFLAMRDHLRVAPSHFAHLDAAQLVKHAFGLRTEAKRRGLRAALVYLFAEPERWPNGKRIEAADRARHRVEIQAFARDVAGAEVAFAHLSYREMIADFERADGAMLHNHAGALRDWFPDI